MSDKHKEEMKKIIEAKKNAGVNHHLKPDKKMGSTHKPFNTQKSVGSNNKV